MKRLGTARALLIVLAFGAPFARAARDTRAAAQTFPEAHFHHLHLNATDPKTAIDFYTTKFDAEKGRFMGVADAVWTQKSWILFNTYLADRVTYETLGGTRPHKALQPASRSRKRAARG